MSKVELRAVGGMREEGEVATGGMREEGGRAG